MLTYNNSKKTMDLRFINKKNYFDGNIKNQNWRK